MNILSWSIRWPLYRARDRVVAWFKRHFLVTHCACWNEEWDRWNTRDEPRCGQRPADFEPDPKICRCRCHQLEYDYLNSVRRESELMNERSALTINLFNMEENFEPAEGIGGGGPISCHCGPAKHFCRTCRKWRKDGPCGCKHERWVCATCKGMDFSFLDA